MFRASYPYQLAVQRATDSPAVAEKIGTPLHIGWFVSGNVNFSGARGKRNHEHSHFRAKGQGHIVVVARSTRINGSSKRLEVDVEGQDEPHSLARAGARISLRKHERQSNLRRKLAGRRRRYAVATSPDAYCPRASGIASAISSAAGRRLAAINPQRRPPRRSILLARDQHLHRPAAPNEPRQPLRSAPTRDDSQRAPRMRKNRIAVSDPRLARQRQIQSSAQTKSANGRNHRLAAARNRQPSLSARAAKNQIPHQP